MSEREKGKESRKECRIVEKNLRGREVREGARARADKMSARYPE